MNRKEYLLAVLSEEAGEIVQSVGKALRFGLFDKRITTAHTNWDDLRLELHDLLAVYEMICESEDRKFAIDAELIEAKKLKIEHYMNYSKQQRCLNDNAAYNY